MISSNGFVKAVDPVCMVCLKNHWRACGIQYFLKEHDADVEMLLLKCKESNAEKEHTLDYIMGRMLEYFTREEILTAFEK